MSSLWNNMQQRKRIKWGCFFFLLFFNDLQGILLYQKQKQISEHKVYYNYFVLNPQIFVLTYGEK